MDSMSLVVVVGSLLVGLALGLVSFYLYRQMLDGKKKNSAQKEADRIVNKAKSQASKIDRDSKSKAKDFESRARRNAENEIRKQKQSLQSQENKFKDKESKLDRDYKRKLEELKQKEQDLEAQTEETQASKQQVRELEKKCRRQIEDIQVQLEKVAGMSTEDAKQELKSSLEEEAREEISERLSEIEADVKKEADQKAKEILATAIARYASEVSTERTVNVVALTSDEMKGKIIGREGRNIRALEAACGVDLIIDETPEAVVISSFDPVRREIAKRALEKLMADGRVHPARIEEAVGQVKKELFKAIKEDGEKACFDLGIHGLHAKIIEQVGGMKYRHTGMHNLFKNCVEVAEISGMIAAEIGSDVKLAKRAGLLHAIGRTIEHTVEGDYATVGADFIKRHGEKPIVVQAVRNHKAKNEKAKSLLDHIVQAAVQLGNARPGARRTMMETYIKRLADLESIGNSFDGVVKTYAVQAGKEIRVVVDSGRITDGQAKMLTRDIARKIERELNYPGQIKVNVIRETRIVEHAR